LALAALHMQELVVTHLLAILLLTAAAAVLTDIMELEFFQKDQVLVLVVTVRHQLFSQLHMETQLED
jgi:hypothetical protein